MIRGVLFALVPTWTLLHEKDTVTVSENPNKSVAEYACALSSQERLDVRHGAHLHFDACFVEPDLLGAARVPDPHAIIMASYPALRLMVLRLAPCLYPANRDFSRDDYVQYCLDFFRMSNPSDGSPQEAVSQKTLFDNRLTIFEEKFLQYKRSLAQVLAHDPGNEDRRNWLLTRANAGFIGTAPRAPEDLLAKSHTVRELETILTKSGALRFLTPQVKDAVFRLERYFYATQLDVHHKIRLMRNNLARNFNACCLIVRVLVALNASSKSEYKGQHVPTFSSGDGAEYDTTSLKLNEEKLTPHNKQDNDIFNALLRLMSIRSAFVAEDGSVHQKVWYVRRPNGKLIESTENTLEHELLDRRWTHSLMQTYESVDKMFANLGGRALQGLVGMLMSGKHATMRDMLKRWPALACPVKNRSINSFRGGVFNAATLQFIAAGHPQRRLPASLLAIKYFKGLHFPSTVINAILEAGMQHVPTRESFRALLPILTSQAIPADEGNLDEVRRNDGERCHGNDGGREDEEGYYAPMQLEEDATQVYTPQGGPSGPAAGYENRGLRFSPQEEQPPVSSEQADAMYKQVYDNSLRQAVLLLPARHVRTVFETQEYTFPEQANIFALLGRTRYSIRDRDNWDVMVIALGVGGTGKSTLLMFLYNLFDRDSVGNMPNRIEKVFGLYAFYDRMVVFGFDLNADFELDQGVLHSMVCGEGVTVSIKFGIAISVLWKTHIIWAMNVLPASYRDTDFSLARRLVPLKFDKQVTARVPTLMHDFRTREIAFFLYQTVFCYEQLVRKKPGASFWEICEPKFLQMRRQLLGDLSVLESFLRSSFIAATPLVAIKLDVSETEIRNKGGVYNEEHLPMFHARYKYHEPHHALLIHWPDKSFLIAKDEPMTGRDEFWNCFKDYCKSLQKKPPGISKDFYEGVFHRYGILEVERTKSHPRGAIIGLALLRS